MRGGNRGSGELSVTPKVRRKRGAAIRAVSREIKSDRRPLEGKASAGTEVAQRCPRGAREGRRSAASGGEGAGGPEGRARRGQGVAGSPGCEQPARPRPGPARPAALTRGPGGVARRCGSSRPAAAAAATAAAEAGTHHAAALMAGPERAPRLGSGTSRRPGLREAAAEQTRERRALPGEPGGATPGSEPRGGQRRRACAVPAAPLGPRRGRGRRLVGAWKPRSSWSPEA